MSKSQNGWGAVIAALVVGGAVIAVAKANSAPPLPKSVVDIYNNLVPLFGFKRPPPLVADSRVANAQSNGVDVRVNPAWLHKVLTDSCDTMACNLSFVAGLLAHELGHHAHREAGLNYGALDEELEADRVAGRVLRRAGYSEVDFKRILARLSGHGSTTHPPGYQRSQAITQGYWTA